MTNEDLDFTRDGITYEIIKDLMQIYNIGTNTFNVTGYMIQTGQARAYAVYCVTEWTIGDPEQNIIDAFIDNYILQTVDPYAEQLAQLQNDLGTDIPEDEQVNPDYTILANNVTVTQNPPSQ